MNNLLQIFEQVFEQVACVVCGKPFDNSDLEREDGDLLDTHCHTCAFWTQHIVLFLSGDPAIVIVDGAHYRLGDDSNRLKGHGGRKFIIHYNDGRTITTNNLWYQGIIPDRFRNTLKDNATFIPYKLYGWVPDEPDMCGCVHHQ